MQRRLDHAEEQDGVAMKRPLTLLWLTVLLPWTAHPDELGRLFYTPDQRAELERDYRRSASAEGKAGGTLMINGIVQKNGGPRTVWINGVAQPAGRSDERHPSSLPVAIPGKPARVEVKVGQRLQVDNPGLSSDGPVR
jgi:hypothetical protein